MTLAHFAQHHPRFVDWSIHVDRLPAAGWLALQFAALTPTWCWMVDRMRDGSDDPLGALALASLAVLVWHLRRELRAAPRLGWMALAACGTLLAAVARTGVTGVSGLGALPALPPLAASLLAVLALACGLIAFLPKRVAALPVAGLAVLALPLLSSLQFYAGYPLRVVTAEASRWLLAPGFDVLREGSTLRVGGRMVIVDAPCSGVQMVWLGYFTACAVALWAQRTDRQFVARLPVVGLLVLLGNIVRNAVLVALEGAGHAPAPWAHDAFGLLLLALVCGGIAWAMARHAAKPLRTGASATPNAIPGLITSPGGRRVDTAL
ncbi:MAG: transrane exosortase-like protein [Variovorax sp.]|nr:transrane exosortase-like protein [Variovorax sp.]